MVGNQSKEFVLKTEPDTETSPPTKPKVPDPAPVVRQLIQLREQHVDQDRPAQSYSTITEVHH